MVKSSITLVKRFFTPYCALVISSAAFATALALVNLPTPISLALATFATLPPTTNTSAKKVNTKSVPPDANLPQPLFLNACSRCAGS